MARRNPMNARYQKNTAPAGKTRKSAAAAKPSRSGGPATGKGSSAKDKSSAGKKSTAVFTTPDTPEFRFWRRIWWWTVILALVLTAVSFALLSLAQLKTASNIVLGLAYGMIFATLYIDWTKIRPMRKAAYIAAKSGKPVKSAEKAVASAEKADSVSKSDNKLAEAAGSNESDTEGRA